MEHMDNFLSSHRLSPKRNTLRSQFVTMNWCKCQFRVFTKWFLLILQIRLQVHTHTHTRTIEESHERKSKKVQDESYV